MASVGRARVVLGRGLLLGGLWWLLTGNELASWMMGVPCIVAAVWAGFALRGRGFSRLSIIGLARFVPFFLWHSLRGGVDVARRLCQRHMPLQPALIRYHSQQLQGGARLFFVNIIALLPGTLSAQLDEHGITVHILDRAHPAAEELAALEAQVANIFQPASAATGQGE